MKIKNLAYRKFLDTQSIDFCNEADIKQYLANIKHKCQTEARCLMIVLYYTGARPSEILDLLAEDIVKEGAYLSIRFKGRTSDQYAKKRTVPRTIKLTYRLPLVKELHDYASGLFPNTYLFYHFKSNYKRVLVRKNGLFSEHLDTTDKLRYFVLKWTNGVHTPYFYRHNRLSKWADQGCQDNELRILKGCRSNESIAPYVHLSTTRQTRIAGKTR